MTAVAQAFDTSEREIIIERLDVHRTGRGKGGYSWQPFNVFAHELDGTPISKALRSFDPLEGTERVTFEPSDKGGAHYMLKRVKGAEQIRARRNVARAAVMGEPAPAEPSNEPSIKARLAAAEARIDKLTERFALFSSLLEQDEARVDALERRIATQPEGSDT